MNTESNSTSNTNSNHPKKSISDAVTVFMVYFVSGALIVYGGVNVSMNILLATRGMYDGQWASALPFVALFGVLPVLAGIILLIKHPATRNKTPQSK